MPIDIWFLRTQHPVVKVSQCRRGQDPEVVTRVLALDSQIKDLQHQIRTARHQRNEQSKEIGRLLASGNSADELRQEIKTLKATITKLEATLKQVTEVQSIELNKIGNIVHSDVPVEPRVTGPTPKVYLGAEPPINSSAGGGSAFGALTPRSGSKLCWNVGLCRH
jgi:seryl-tRNA synthetase